MLPGSGAGRGEAHDYRDAALQDGEQGVWLLRGWCLWTLYLPDVADDCDGAEAGGYLPRNQRTASPPGGAHRLESSLV